MVCIVISWGIGSYNIFCLVKTSKSEQIEQKQIEQNWANWAKKACLFRVKNEVTEMGKRLVYYKAVNPMQAAYPDAVVAKSLRACCGRRTEKKQ